MFTFTKKADYALLALSYLSTEGGGRIVGPREIARRYDIPAELLAKVMQTLARRRIVASVPGPTGGYKLVRPAADVSVAEVLEAVDGPLAIAQCWDDGPDACAQSPHCHLRGPLARIQEEMVRLLRATTLADVSATTGRGAAFPERRFEPDRVLSVVGRTPAGSVGAVGSAERT